MEWQSMDTAPKDGRWVLVYGNVKDDSADNWRITSAQWTTELNGRVVDGHWQFAWYDGGYYGEVIAYHWMPLPSTPE